jgi:hypothetical protein
MDGKFLRTLIYIFSGIIVLFSLLMLINYVGSWTSSGPETAAREELSRKTAGAADQARQALAAAKYSGGARGSLVPTYRQDISSDAVNASGAIMLVKEKTFGGVAEAPKGMMDLLNDLSGGNKGKPAPIALKEADLGKKIVVEGNQARDPKLTNGVMPELGRSPGQEGLTLLTAPVDYKLFKSSVTWSSFETSRKMKPVAYDFDSGNLLILISVSDFPSGIFSITAVENGKKETVVRYRVNPLGMADGASKEQREAYASAMVPKNKPVRLEQVP